MYYQISSAESTQHAKLLIKFIKNVHSCKILYVWVQSPMTATKYCFSTFLLINLSRHGLIRRQLLHCCLASTTGRLKLISRWHLAFHTFCCSETCYHRNPKLILNVSAYLLVSVAINKLRYGYKWQPAISILATHSHLISCLLALIAKLNSTDDILQHSFFLFPL